MSKNESFSSKSVCFHRSFYSFIPLWKMMFSNADPNITITFDKEPVTGGNTHPRTPTEIICSVNMTSSQPRFKVYYLGDQSHTKEHLYTKSEFKKHALYNHGKYYVGIRLPPSKGIVVCQVEDSLGTYTKHQEIVGRGEINHLYINQITNWMGFSLRVCELETIGYPEAHLVWNCKWDIMQRWMRRIFSVKRLFDSQLRSTSIKCKRTFRIIRGMLGTLTKSSHLVHMNFIIYYANYANRDNLEKNRLG